MLEVIRDAELHGTPMQILSVDLKSTFLHNFATGIIQSYGIGEIPNNLHGIAFANPVDCLSQIKYLQNFFFPLYF